MLSDSDKATVRGTEDHATHIFRNTRSHNRSPSVQISDVRHPPPGHAFAKGPRRMILDCVEVLVTSVRYVSVVKRDDDVGLIDLPEDEKVSELFHHDLDAL